MDDSTVIELEHISMKYRTASEKLLTLKEYAVAAAKRKLKYQDFWVFRDVNLSIQKGDIIGIIGRNGAGKSTLLKIIAGVLEPTKGQVLVKGNIVPMLELGSGFDIDLTGRENIFLNGAILGYSEQFLKEKYDEIVEFSELGSFIENSIRSYSSGMLMRLAFSIATVVNPEVLIVDEILAVGDEAFQQKSKRRMLSLMSGGTTVLFVSHSLGQVRELCNKVAWLEDGKLRMYGDTKTVCDAYHESNDLDSVMNMEESGLYENHMDRSARDVLYVYGRREYNYYWRVGIGKEQLLSCGISSGEIWHENITDNLADQFSVFIFIECMRSQRIEAFIKLVKTRNKKVVFDVTERDDRQLELIEACKRYVDSVLLADETLGSLFGGTINRFILPYMANDRIAQLAMREKYERDVMPGMKLGDFDSEEMKLRYKQACVRRQEHINIGYRILCLTQSSAEDKSKMTDTVIRLDKIHHPDHQWDIRSIYDDYDNEYDTLPGLIASYDLITFPHTGGSYNGAEERFKVVAGLTGVPVAYLIDGTDRFAYEISHDCEKKETTRLAIHLGYHLGNFIKNLCGKRYAFLINLDDHNMPDSISELMVRLCSRGDDVVILDGGDRNISSLYNNLIPIVNLKQKYITVHFDVMITVGWECFEYLRQYPYTKEKYNYIEEFCIDQYDPGDIRRFRISQAIYDSDCGVCIVSDKEEITGVYKQMYGIEVQPLSAVMHFDQND